MIFHKSLQCPSDDNQMLGKTKIHGMYSQFTGMDYLEAQSIISDTKEGISPKTLEIETLFSTLGQ